MRKIVSLAGFQPSNWIFPQGQLAYEAGGFRLRRPSALFPWGKAARDTFFPEAI